MNRQKIQFGKNKTKQNKNSYLFSWCERWEEARKLIQPIHKLHPTPTPPYNGVVSISGKKANTKDARKVWKISSQGKNDFWRPDLKLTKDNEGIVTQNKVLMSLHAWFSGLRIFLQSTGNQGSDLTNNRNPNVCIF